MEKREYSQVVEKLEEAIDLVDKIMSFVNKLRPEEKTSPGVVFQIYQNLVLLREKIIETRMEAVEKCA